MPRGRWPDRMTVGLLLAAAPGVFALQVALNTPVAGPLGLVLLAIPGYAIAETIGPRPLRWPERLLVVLGATLTITVLVGIFAALAPAGLRARTVAVPEVAILALISIAWLRRVVHRQGRPVVRRASSGIAVRTLLLVALGTTFASAGIVIATGSAADQPHPGVVQFWALPARPTVGASVGIANLSEAPLECGVTIDRPDRGALAWNPGTVAPGETVVGLLPEAERDEAAPWRLALECTGAADGLIERQASIDPPR